MMHVGDHQPIQPLARTGPPAAHVAASIVEGFNRHYALFRYGAQRAKSLFESGDWRGIQQLSRERIEYYDMRVRECSSALATALRGSRFGMEADRVAVSDSSAGHGLPDLVELTDEQKGYWRDVRAAYVRLLADHKQPECAETFFNSVSCRVLHRNYFHNAFLFVRPAVSVDYIDSQRPSYRTYYPCRQGVRQSLIQMMVDFGLAAPFRDLPADMRHVARRGAAALRQVLTHQGGPRLAPDFQIQVLNSLFFRNKGAYVVGRVVNHGATYPFAVALLKTPSGHIYIDALLHGTDDLSTLFSFTRAYFLVDMEVPSAYVHFLSSLLPRKPQAELYTAIGLQKQGKTLFYRDFLQHLSHSHDRFELAPGIKGLVMTVFTLPSYPYVFKLIRDRIAKPDMTRATVRRKYQLVKRHDRVGRMADTWEYSQVALPRHRFSPELLKELRQEVPSLLEEHDDIVVLRHVYIERRMTPLNLYMSKASDHAVERAIKGYGDAIRELASANIFPGDMLFKNFGLTRLGRVVFYDYDEIQHMTEMRFRRIPPAPYEEAELSAEPWYPVAANDVFPEEFRPFLLGDPRVSSAFLKHHACLLEAQWWEDCQKRAAQGRVEDIYPYEPDRRLNAAVADSLNSPIPLHQGANHV